MQYYIESEERTHLLWARGGENMFPININRRNSCTTFIFAQKSNFIVNGRRGVSA